MKTWTANLLAGLSGANLALTTAALVMVWTVTR